MRNNIPGLALLLPAIVMDDSDHSIKNESLSLSLLSTYFLKNILKRKPVNATTVCVCARAQLQ
jgi:hypothetical protein